MHRAAEPGEDPSQWADPAAVTDVFLFLASEESRGVSGRRFLAQEDWRGAASPSAVVGGGMSHGSLPGDRDAPLPGFGISSVPMFPGPHALRSDSGECRACAPGKARARPGRHAPAGRRPPHGRPTHTVFNRIGDFLRPGDCLVFNASRTLPAVLPRRRFRKPGRAAPNRRAPEAWASASAHPPGPPLGRRRMVRAALDREDEPWRGDLPESDSSFPRRLSRIRPDWVIPRGGAGRDPLVDRLWKIRFSRSRAGSDGGLVAPGGSRTLLVCVLALGSGLLPDRVRPRTGFGGNALRRAGPSPGSCCWSCAAGVGTAFLVLHAGLSSYMDGTSTRAIPPPWSLSAWMRLRPELINAAKARGGRIVAVGTTVVRALESIADECGRVQAGREAPACASLPDTA